jgi:hypothetical protein
MPLPFQSHAFTVPFSATPTGVSQVRRPLAAARGVCAKQNRKDKPFVQPFLGETSKRRHESGVGRAEIDTSAAALRWH